MTPIRVQLRRAKGWKMPPDTVSVARPGKFGNPFKVGELRPVPPDGVESPRTAAEAVRGFSDWIATPGNGMLELAMRDLRGKNLACFCPLDAPCHADVLLDLVNREPLE